MREVGESTNNNTNGKHTQRRGASTPKKQTFSNKIDESKNDTKQLFHLINNITMSKIANPMPEGKMDAQLAKEFASFFLQKIEKIRLLFQDTEEYISEVNTSVPVLWHLLPMTSKEIERELLSKKNQTCELDTIPRNLLKDIIPTVLETITQIVNILLKTGTLPLDWKTAIIRPLLKKARLELTKKNYRPVSNFCFLSKLVEYCV